MFLNANRWQRPSSQQKTDGQCLKDSYEVHAYELDYLGYKLSLTCIENVLSHKQKSYHHPHQISEKDRNTVGKKNAEDKA